MDRESRSVSEDDSGYVTLQITTTRINSVPERQSEPMDYLRATSFALAGQLALRLLCRHA